MMTYLQNSFTMPGATSPVNAPFSSQYKFWAPRPIPEFSSNSYNAGIAMKGGHSTFSTLGISRNFAMIVETRSRASATVLFIFQFPATTGVRFIIMATSLGVQQQKDGPTQAGRFDLPQDPAEIGGQFPDRLQRKRVHLQAGILHAKYPHIASTDQ